VSPTDTDIATIIEESGEDTATVDLLVFRVGSSSYGVCIDQILEITEVEEFVRVTAADASLRGALLTRGRSVPMIDVVRRLGLPPLQRYTAPVLLVTDIAQRDIGFLVDDPEDVISATPESFRALPELIHKTQASDAVYAIAIAEERLVLLLDLQVLVEPKEAIEASALARDATKDQAPT
jgi:purine-binding chemotaxis protein CheW